MSHFKSVADIYKSVVNDVIDGVKYAFLDDSIDDQVLQELRQLWESKLMQSKAVEPPDHKLTAVMSLPAASTVQIKQQSSQQPHQHLQQPLTAQLLTAAAASSSAVTIAQQQQPLNVQGQVLITPAPQLGNTSQTSTIAIPPNFQQHITSLQYLVPPGQPGQFVIQTASGARFIQSQQGLPGTVLVAAPSNTTTPAGQNLTTQTVNQQVIQLDGLHDSSSDDEEEEEEDEEQNDDNEEPQGEEEDPLNSDDDVSDTDPMEVFDAENVVVCQFDKINRSKNKWKFHLKDGIMNLNGRDFVFQKATGDAEW